MIKSISLLTRKAGLSHEEFVKHWLEVHAPLAHAVPGLRRYVQSHIVGERTRWRSAVDRAVDAVSGERHHDDRGSSDDRRDRNDAGQRAAAEHGEKRY